jgi:hypothetical protein
VGIFHFAIWKSACIDHSPCCAKICLLRLYLVVLLCVSLGVMPFYAGNHGYGGYGLSSSALILHSIYGENKEITLNILFSSCLDQMIFSLPWISFIRTILYFAFSGSCFFFRINKLGNQATAYYTSLPVY